MSSKPTPKPFRGITEVVSRNGLMVGTVVGDRACRLAGCTGHCLAVVWPDGRHTYPCLKGMRETEFEHRLQIDDGRPAGHLQPPIDLAVTVGGLLPSIVRTGPTVRQVRNLGWLIRHWREVDRLEVYDHPPVISGMRPDAYLVARLADGRTYETGYSDIGVMKGWLSRSQTLSYDPNYDFRT